MRTHDSFYVDSNRHSSPTELTKWMLELCEIPNIETFQVLDVGCANGEFLFQVRSIAPAVQLTGADVLEELLISAKRSVPAARFVNASVVSPNFASVVGTGFDLVSMKGVHSIFDDPIPAILNLIGVASSQKPAKVVIVGLFNEYPIDVYITYRGVDQPNDHRENGWNIVSHQTIEAALMNNSRVENFHWEKFVMKLEIASQVDPVRSWTLELADGKLAITNGLNLLQPIQALVIRTKPEPNRKRSR